jgi:hypothetical protein
LVPSGDLGLSNDWDWKCYLLSTTRAVDLLHPVRVSVGSQKTPLDEENLGNYYQVGAEEIRGKG